MKILHVVGARPNFMKIAPILAQLRNYHGVEQVLVHTGQHYDAKMSGVFFEELGMPEPDVHLGVGSGTHAQQTARVMVEIEPVLEGGGKKGRIPELWDGRAAERIASILVRR
jgi:UDP-N-acetylglucosamine 2-epimerase (non-hydrolysing)